MSLWQRTPREVYRVYGEDEYLVGDSASGESEASAERTAFSEDGALAQRAISDQDASLLEDRSSFQASSPFAPRGAVFPTALEEPFSHSRRLLGLGLLVAATVGALALVVLNASHRSGTPSPSATAGAATRDARTRGAGHGAVIAREAPSERSVDASAPDLERTPHTSRVTSSSVIAPGRFRSSLAPMAGSDDSTVRLSACCGQASSPALGRSAVGLPVAAPPALSTDNEFDFER
jgi:hypothetical protein